jgi:hypothetical protein
MLSLVMLSFDKWVNLTESLAILKFASQRVFWLIVGYHISLAQSDNFKRHLL